MTEEQFSKLVEAVASNAARLDAFISGKKPEAQKVENVPVNSNYEAKRVENLKMLNDEVSDQSVKDILDSLNF